MAEPIEGIVVREYPAKNVEYFRLLNLLAAMADGWDDEARNRTSRAQNGQLFGPKMMMYATEGSVLAACAAELRDLLLKETQDERMVDGNTGGDGSGRPAVPGRPGPDRPDR